ncbi:MAG: Ig-like domain-containing protein [Nitrososphaeraceae archaeon]
MTNIKNFKVFMHVDRYYYAAHMYKKCLILGLLILISGNVINFTFQFYDGQRIFAQTNQSPEADDQKVSVDANDKIKIILEGKDDDKDDEIKFDIVSDPSHGKLDNFDKSDGTVTYSPEEDYSGDDEFKFKVVDDKGAESNTGDVEITVKSVTETNQQSATTGDETNQQSATTGDETNMEAENQTTRQLLKNNESIANNQPPFAYDQDLSIHMNEKADISLTGKDDDNDLIQFAIVSNPTDASLDNFDSTKGTLTFVPKTDYIGNESFAFKVIDDKGNESNVATVSVEVKENNQTNQAPLAFDQSTNESNSDIHKYVVWSAGEEEDRYILFARSTDGKSFSSPLSLSGSSRSNVFNPEASSSGNNIYVVWQGQSATGNQDIFLRKSSNYGASFSAAENISNDPGGSGNPDIAAVGNDTHITWEGTTPGNNFVFYTKSDNGSDFGTPQKLGGNQGISYRPEISVKENTITSPDSFTYKAVDDMGAESNVATVDVNLDTNTNGEANLKDNGKSVSIDSAHEVEITLKAKDQDKDPLQFEIITPPSEGRLFNFDPNSGTVKYIPNENNEIDINWHNYVSGHDRVLTKNIESSDTPIGKDNGDPFKSR